ncbi:hypothetical protein L1887_61632 [Cichorium endivia]|nr:hypothetical protein L1887_61632 [Cichorium endivia]
MMMVVVLVGGLDGAPKLAMRRGTKRGDEGRGVEEGEKFKGAGQGDMTPETASLVGSGGGARRQRQPGVRGWGSQAKRPSRSHETEAAKWHKVRQAYGLLEPSIPRVTYGGPRTRAPGGSPASLYRHCLLKRACASSAACAAGAISLSELGAALPWFLRQQGECGGMPTIPGRGAAENPAWLEFQAPTGQARLREPSTHFPLRFQRQRLSPNTHLQTLSAALALSTAARLGSQSQPRPNALVAAANRSSQLDNDGFGVVSTLLLGQTATLQARCKVVREQHEASYFCGCGCERGRGASQGRSPNKFPVHVSSLSCEKMTFRRTIGTTISEAISSVRRGLFKLHPLARQPHD